MSELQHDGAEDAADRRAERVVAGVERAALWRMLPLALFPVGFSYLFLLGVLNGAWGFGLGIGFEVAALWFFHRSLGRRLPATRDMAAGATYHARGKHDALWGWLLTVGGVYAGFALGPEVQDLLESWW